MELALTSRPCPSCRESISIDVTAEQVQAYAHGAYIQDVLPDLDAGTRERFISGFCPACWVELFGDDEE